MHNLIRQFKINLEHLKNTFMQKIDQIKITIWVSLLYIIIVTYRQID